jgi:general stress protein 26
VHACIHGALSIDQDRERIDRYWNPVVAAWYPDGKDDPQLTLVRFDGEDGRVWVSDKGVLGFGYQILKANLTKTLPDAGGVADVNLS